MKGYITRVGVTPDIFGGELVNTGRVEIEMQVENIEDYEEFKEALEKLKRVNVIIGQELEGNNGES